MYSIDWAVKKEFKVYNINTKKFKSISPTRETFDKFFNGFSNFHSFYIEEGGGDTFKLLALKYGHQVFTTPGKKIKDFRDKLCLDKTDENDVKIIGIFAKKYSQEFYEYKKSDVLTLKIAILHKEYCKIVKDSTRKKNQLFALKKMLELLTSEKEIIRIISKQKDTIKSFSREVRSINSQLLKLLKKHSLWNNYLKDVKGVGPIIAAGIIGSIRRFSRFSNKYSFRQFAGMVTKQNNFNYNRQLKQALYNFTEQIIKQKIQPWRQLYDNMKMYYKEKHSDWIPGKIDAYAKKFVQTKFLDKLWINGIKIEIS